jgi:hypothetical protein
MPRLTPEQLEAQLHAVLRDQPLRRAPAGLEMRVLQEIARRQARPWWQQNYSGWPTPVRLLFLVGSLSLFIVAAWLAMRGLADVPFEQAGSLVLQPIRDALSTLQSAGSVLLEVAKGWVPTLPTVWIYALLGAVALGYATLIGLGATAYRVFWQAR